ncbi:S-adenosyl-L-methionine-dependent methyltransferase [Delitschia confertaspora ATCC 74209]|uniref:S-adenosyl-L-methionine-dependent methyltransferase n=1 Tax=Delitschia confertaspora ATCC 74209 TaxID=1513339 RepID=A0A9P4MV12_9PLEO|nr:S-adenosyl-L-methionine-dependent methyltransferase [Delitschia confertaspora ATCC 74209]
MAKVTEALCILTMSVTSSVYDYRFENGRRYHAYAEGKYPVPNDEVEKDRLDLQHHAFRLTLDGALYRAPISKNIQDVLDVGTGTGIWAIEFAEEHPSATVLGTDLSPIQPTEVPPNCSFLIDDCDNDWVFRQKFDYVHSRAMVAAIKDWPRFFEQAYNNLKPGGYLECQEITFPAMATDPTLTPENSPLLRWSQLFGEAAHQIGLDHEGPRKFAPMLRAQGFVDIHAKQYNWPIGRWAKGKKNKALGTYVMEDLHDWLPSSALALFTRVLKWSREEVEVFLATVRNELKDKSRHFYAHVIVWVARKPENSLGVGSADDFVLKDDERLESDEEGPAPSNERESNPNKDHKEVTSPGALANEAAGLTLASPIPSIDTDERIAEPSVTASGEVVDSVSQGTAKKEEHVDSSSAPGPPEIPRTDGNQSGLDTTMNPGAAARVAAVNQEQDALASTQQSSSAAEGPGSGSTEVPLTSDFEITRPTGEHAVVGAEPDAK